MSTHTTTQQMISEAEDTAIRKTFRAIDSVLKSQYGASSVSAVIGSIKERKTLVAVIAVFIAIASYGAYERYFHLTDAERAQKGLATATGAISELMLLPEGDEPVLATVTDIESLVKQQAFFAGAVNGDQLLLFPRNMKAVLYSPSRNVIVNAGPIQQQTPTVMAGNTTVSEQGSIVQQSATTLSVEVRNGSGKNGLGALVAEQITKNGAFAIAHIGDAKSNSYKTTVVVDVAKKTVDREAINTLASSLGAAVVSELPKGEAKSSADAVVILGSGTNL